MNKTAQLLLAPLMGIVTIWSFLVPDAKNFMAPQCARIFFWHLPCPLTMTAFLFLGCYFAARQFVRIEGTKLVPETDVVAQQQWDLRAESALELGGIFAVLTMVTGIIFSYAQWGAAWQWDPRQTSFLFALILFGAYFAVRAAFTDPEKRATFSAGYMMAAILPITFLTFIFPRLPQIQAISFHPTDSVMRGQIKGQYAYVVLSTITLVGFLSVWLYRLRVAAGTLLLNHGSMENHLRPTTATPVVRPVRVSHSSDEDRGPGKA